MSPDEKERQAELPEGWEPTQEPVEAEDDFWRDSEPLSDALLVRCPHCFEEVEIFVESDVSGSLVQDCEVCCHPWQLTIERRHGEAPRLSVDML